MLILVGLAVAVAGPRDPASVLYEGDPTAAVERSSDDAGLPVERLDPTRWSTLLADNTLWIEGAAFPAKPCEAVDLATLQGRLEAAEGWFFSMVLDRAAEELDALLDGLCGLTEPVDPALAGRATYLRGVVAALDEKEAAAVAHFQRARDFEPELAWDATLQAEPLPAFQQVRAPTPPARLVLDPHLDPRNVLVDGRPLVPVTGPHVVGEGVHLLQVVAPEVRTLRITVGSGAEVRIIDPLALPPGLGAHPEDPAGQALTAWAVARSAAPLQERVLWSGEAGTWELDRTLMAWDQRRAGPNWLLVGGGAGLAAAGTGVALWARARGAGLVAEYEPGVDSQGEYDALADALARQRWAWRLGWTAGAVGLALSGTALVLPRLQARIVPGPTPLGAALHVGRRP